MAGNQILLFGDSADPPIPLIRQLLAKSQHSNNTQLFIQTSVEAVGREIQKLSPLEREAIGVFYDIHDLQECYENKKDPFNIAHIVLNFVARVGELILHAEKDPSLLIGNGSQVIALSISGSMLAAAAAAVANDVGELIEVATYLVVVSCRQAVEIRRQGMRIDSERGEWAFSAIGEITSELDSIISRFHNIENVPRHRQAYIGIQATSWATIFGPPSTLRSLVASSAPLKKSNVMMLPALGPAHAPHLKAPDMEYLIGTSDFLEKTVKPDFKLISGSISGAIPSTNLRKLLEHILKDIFQNTAYPERVFEAGISCLRREQETALFVLGNTTYLPSFRRTMQKKRLKVSMKSNSSSSEDVENHVKSESVAIIGISGRFPGSETIGDLWASLLEQKDFHEKVPSDRFDVEEDPKSSIFGCFLENPGLFDHKLFNVSPREAVQMDPGQRLLLHSTFEALQTAGITVNGTRSTDSRRISTFIGIGADDWRELHQALGVESHWIHGNERGFDAGRLNHYFNWEGATFCVDSACGSSASATALAFKALMNRDCDTAIVGGANIIATPFWHSALSNGGFLSMTGGCKTFRSDADGYCRGEGVGILVLKRQDDALQDNDKIVAVIRGYARNHSAESTSITHPHVGTQERVFRTLLHKTGLEPDDIDYVEFHGTGTTVGDATEIESISNVFTKSGSRQKPLVVGAIKANIAHSEAAAGVLSLIKGALVLQNKIVPGQVGIPQNLGNYPALKGGRILVPGDNLPLAAGGKKSRILVNNFDAAGGNTCFILEEPDRKAHNRDLDPRSYHVVTVSAHSAKSLNENKKRMLRFLRDNKNVCLADLAYTSTARRNHYSLRSAYYGSSADDIAISLSRDLDINAEELKANKKPAIVFMFSGQGGSYAGMGKDLFKASRQFRELINELQDICISLQFPPFLHLLADGESKFESVGIVEQHLALVALQIGLSKYWEICGIKPDVVIGHSIGEYAALCTAGVLSLFDTLYLVGTRAQLLQFKCTAGTHAMLSVSGSTSEIAAIISSRSVYHELSCINSPGMIVMSGEINNVALLNSKLRLRGLKCKILDIPYGMHTSQVDVVLGDYTKVLSGIQFNKPKVKVISTHSGHEMTDASSFGKDYLVRQMRGPVNFQQAVISCLEQGHANEASQWLEIGPNSTCVGLLRKNINVDSRHALASLKKGEDNWKHISIVLKTMYTTGLAINWRAFHTDFVECLSLVDLPTYAFDTRNFWLTYQKINPSPRAINTNTASIAQQDPISTCLHYVVEQIKESDKSATSFRSALAHNSLQKIVQGHKLSGTAVCPAGVFMDIALTATRYLLASGKTSILAPPLVVFDVNFERPVVSDSTGSTSKLIYSTFLISENKDSEFNVSFRDGSGSLSSKLASCRVSIHDRAKFEADVSKHSLEVSSKIATLVQASDMGDADRVRGKMFYKLFSSLMEYGDHFKGVQSAIVNDDFSEILTTVNFSPVAKTPDQSFTFSPYWLDIIGQGLGFLLNANPNLAGDYVHMGSHVGHFEVHAQGLDPDQIYQIYSYIESTEGPETRGNAFIMHDGTMVGFLRDMRFHKMSRKTLQHLLGGDVPPKESSDKKSHESVNRMEDSVHREAAQHQPLEANGTTTSLTTSFMKILLDETGLFASEVTPSSNFSEMGVDSIFAISIMGALKTETGVELGASFLSENPTLEDAQKALRMLENQTRLSTSTDLTQHGNSIDHPAFDEISSVVRESNVVLIQRALTPNPRTLFLIADGAGSAAAYVHLPQVGNSVQVLALESPWVKDPENFNCSFSEAAALYLQALRAKQPSGPYLLGGWSGGGVFAYEVSRLLLEAGETVLGLIIIDMLAPRQVDRSEVMMPTFEIVENMGLLVGIDRAKANDTLRSKQMKEHMFGTVKCFSKLDPTPMKRGFQPNSTFVIWATHLITSNVEDDRNAQVMRRELDAWFYPQKHDFGPNDWDLLVGGSVECISVPGDHFSIMNTPHVQELGGVLRDIAQKCFGSPN